MEEKFSIKKLKEMIKDYLIAQEDRMSLILEEWKDEDNVQIKQELKEIEEKISEYQEELLYVERNKKILDRVEEEFRALKKQVGGVSNTKYIEGYYPDAISDIVDKILTNELIEQDKSKLKIKDAKVYTAFKRELEEKLDAECGVYNADICNIGEPEDTVTVMEGIDNKGKKQIVYYYCYSDSNFSEILSQRRSYNEKQDVELVERKMLSDNGEYKNLDGESIVYKYDKDGRKKIALGDNDIIGAEYFEYDKNGKIKLAINEESITQYLNNGEKDYFICDGYFKPTNNGYILLPSKSKYDIEKEEIKRIVGGNLSQEDKEQILSELTPKRQEEVLRILRSMEPIFEYYEDIDSMNTEKREKIISWFKGFSKDLKIDDRKKENHTAEKIANGINVREEQINEIQGETIKAVEEQKDKEEQSFGGE